MSGRSRTLEIEILGDGSSAEKALGSISTASEKTGSRLGTLAKVGGAAIAGLGVAAATAFGVGFARAAEAEKALDRLQAQAGLTEDETARLGDVARNVFEGAWGDSIPGVLEDISTIRRNLGEMSDQELQRLTEKFLTIEDLWGAPVEETSRVVDTLRSNFDDLTEDQALDIIAKGFQDGGDASGDLLDTLNEYAPAFSNIGLTAEQFLGSLIAGADAGAFNMDKVGDAVNEFQIRAQDGSETTKEAFEAIGLSADDMSQAIAEGGETGERAFQATLAAIAQIEDPVQRNIQGAALFGSQWEDVGEDVVLAMAEGQKGIEDLDGTAERAADDAYDNWQTAFEGIKRQALGALEDAATPALLAFADFMEDRGIPALEGALDVISDIGQALGEGDFSGALGQMLDVLGDVRSSALDLGGRLAGGIAGAIAGVDWSGVASTLWEGILDGLRDFAEAGSQFASWFVGAITGVDWSGVGSSILDGILAGLGAVADAGARFVSWLVDTVTGVDWVGLGTAVLDGLLAGLGAVADAGSRLVSWISGTLTEVDWSGLGTTIVEGLLTAVSAVEDFGSRLVSWITGTLADVEWVELGNTVVNGLQTGIQAVEDFGQRVVSWISGQLSAADWSGMQESLQSGLGSALEGLQGLGESESLSGLTSFLNETLMPALTTIADEVGPRVAPTIDRMRDSFSEIADIVGERAGPLLQQARDTFTEMQPVLQTVATIVGGVLLAALTGLGSFLAEILPPIIEGALLGIENILLAFESLAVIVTGTVDIIKSLLEGDFSGAFEAAQEMVQRVNDNIIQILSNLGQTVLGLISGLVEGVIGFFESLYSTLVGGSIIPDMVNGIIDWIRELPSQIPGILSEFVGSAVGFFTDLATEGAAKAGELVTNTLSELGNLVTLGPSRISDFATGALTNLGGFVTDGVGEIGRFVGDALEDLAGFVTDAASAVGELPGKAVEALGDLGSTLFSAGEDLIQGFVDGITSIDVGSVASGVGQGAIDAISSFGMSPWPAMIESGRDAGEGLLLGLEESRPRVREAAGSLGTEIQDGFNNRLGDFEITSQQVAQAILDGATATDDWRTTLIGQLDAMQPELDQRGRDATATLAEGIKSGAIDLDDAIEALQAMLAGDTSWADTGSKIGDEIAGAIAEKVGDAKANLEESGSSDTEDEGSGSGSGDDASDDEPASPPGGGSSSPQPVKESSGSSIDEWRYWYSWNGTTYAIGQGRTAAQYILWLETAAERGLTQVHKEGLAKVSIADEIAKLLLFADDAILGASEGDSALTSGTGSSGQGSSMNGNGGGGASSGGGAGAGGININITTKSSDPQEIAREAEAAMRFVALDPALAGVRRG